MLLPSFVMLVGGVLSSAAIVSPFAFFTYRRRVLTHGSFALLLFLEAMCWAYLAYIILAKGPCSSEGCEPRWAASYVVPSNALATIAALCAVAGIAALVRGWRRLLILSLATAAGVYGPLALLYGQWLTGASDPSAGLSGLVTVGLPLATLIGVFTAANRLGRAHLER